MKILHFNFNARARIKDGAPILQMRGWQSQGGFQNDLPKLPSRWRSIACFCLLKERNDRRHGTVGADQDQQSGL